MTEMNLGTGQEVSRKGKTLGDIFHGFVRGVGSFFKSGGSVAECPPELDHETLYWEVWPIVKARGYYPEITLGIVKEYEAVHGNKYSDEEIIGYIERRTDELVKNPDEWRAMFAANDRSEQARKNAAEKAWVKSCVEDAGFHLRS